MNERNDDRLQRLVRQDTYWQPHKDEMPNSLYSFEVYLHLENGKCDYPDVKRWVEYHGDDIEDPEFVDA